MLPFFAKFVFEQLDIICSPGLLLQVANELKNTGYTPKMAILGSRKQYCINESVRQSPAGIDNACRDKIETQKGCEFFKGKEKTMAAAHRAPPVRSSCVSPL